jgi:hypothetical protein
MEYVINSPYDSDVPYWQNIVQEIQELSSNEGQEETKTFTSGEVNKNSWILVLQGKDNATKVIRDWDYPIAPTTYYCRHGVLGIDQYDLVDVKENRAYYKYVGENLNKRLIRSE